MKNKVLYGTILSLLLIFPKISNAQWTTGYGNAGMSGLPSGTVSNIVMNLMYWLLGLVGVIGIIGFVIAGILYIIAAGDEGKMEMGKNAMTWSIIGMIVALMGYVIIQAVDSMLGGTNHMF